MDLETSFLHLIHYIALHCHYHITKLDKLEVYSSSSEVIASFIFCNTLKIEF
jgi:hypothetical protein